MHQKKCIHSVNTNTAPKAPPGATTILQGKHNEYYATFSLPLVAKPSLFSHTLPFSHSPFRSRLKHRIISPHYVPHAGSGHASPSAAHGALQNGSFLTRLAIPRSRLPSPHRRSLHMRPLDCFFFLVAVKRSHVTACHLLVEENPKPVFLSAALQASRSRDFKKKVTATGSFKHVIHSFPTHADSY